MLLILVLIDKYKGAIIINIQQKITHPLSQNIWGWDAKIAHFGFLKLGSIGWIALILKNN
jgi:hypothetical protein